MHYLLAIYRSEEVLASMTRADGERMHGAFAAYTKALHDAGVWVAGSQLGGADTATTVRVDADGKSSVLDGPYADTKEQLGGYYIIEAADIDAAISWAARCPGAAYGTMEVRPVIAAAARV